MLESKNFKEMLSNRSKTLSSINKFCNFEDKSPLFSDEVSDEDLAKDRFYDLITMISKTFKKKLVISRWYFGIVDPIIEIKQSSRLIHPSSFSPDTGSDFLEELACHYAKYSQLLPNDKNPDLNSLPLAFLLMNENKPVNIDSLTCLRKYGSISPGLSVEPIKLYPNPVSRGGKLTIEIPFYHDKSRCEFKINSISDFEGKTVNSAVQFSQENGFFHGTIDVSNLQAGIYAISVNMSCDYNANGTELIHSFSTALKFKVN
jgi:hypothetical protein